MGTNREDRDQRQRGAHYFKAGWVLLVAAVLAIAITILATAAQPHVLWLFSTSYGAVMLVVGGTLIRMSHVGRAATDERRGGSIEGCRT